MRVLLKGYTLPDGSPKNKKQQQQQQDNKNETKSKKKEKTNASASAAATSKEAAASSAAKKDKNKTMKSSSSMTNSKAEEEDQRMEQREDQSIKDQSSKRSAVSREKEEKKKKKKERIPLIDRVPTAMEYDSDDSLERMVRQKSRYSRYMTEYDVSVDNFVDDDDADGDNGDGQDEVAMDKYNGIARLWSNSTDSDPPQWRSWDDGETPADNADAPKDSNNKFLVANVDDEISAMFHSKPTPGKFTDELKKVVSSESNRPLFSKMSQEDILKWEHIENTMEGQVETVLDPVKALGLADIGDDDDDDDDGEEDDNDIEQIIRPTSSDTSSLTDPIKREEMLIAARIRASANENENLKQPDVPRVLSLTKKRSHATQQSTSEPALTTLNSNDSTNEPRTGVSKGTASASSPSLIQQAKGQTAQDTAAAQTGGACSLIDEYTAMKNAALDKGDKTIPKVDTILTSTSSSSSKSSKAQKNYKQNRPVRGSGANPKGTSGTIATEVSDDVTKPKTGNTGEEDAAVDDATTKSRKSFFARVPLFRSLSGLRGVSKSRDGKSRTGTPTPKRAKSDIGNERSGHADKGEDNKEVQKPLSRKTVDKYTPTEEKVKIVAKEAPIPPGGDENVISSSDARVSPENDAKVSPDDDKKDTDTKTPSDNDDEMKECPPPNCDKTIVAANDNPDDSEQPPPAQENNEPQDMNALLTATDQDKQEPAWCDTGKRGLTPAERNLMYSKSLVNDSGSESSILDRVTGGKKANMVYKARKAKKAQMMELDEYSYAVSVDVEPDVVQCLKFYYCGAVAAVFGVAIAATDCNNPKKQIKGTEVRTGLLSNIEEVDEVEAQRWRDDNTLSPKVEVILENVQETAKPVDQVDIDLAKGKRQQHNRKKKASKGEAHTLEKDDMGIALPRVQNNDEEEESDGETPELEIEHQISRVKEVTKMHFSLEEDSEENQRHEAMLRARRMAAQPQRQEIPITSIQIPTKSMESNEEHDPNPAAEEREEYDNKDVGGEIGGDVTPKLGESGSENNQDENEVGRVKRIGDDETMETSTGSSQESAGSRSKRSRSAPPQKRKRLFRFLPRLGRKTTKEDEDM